MSQSRANLPGALREHAHAQDRALILQYIQNHQGTTVPDVARDLELTEAYVRKRVRELVAQGHVQRRRPGECPTCHPRPRP